MIRNVERSVEIQASQAESESRIFVLSIRKSFFRVQMKFCIFRATMNPSSELIGVLVAPSLPPLARIAKSGFMSPGQATNPYAKAATFRLRKGPGSSGSWMANTWSSQDSQSNMMHCTW